MGNKVSHGGLVNGISVEAQAAAAAASEGSRAGAELEVQMQQFPRAVMYHQAEAPRDASSGTAGGPLPAGTSPAAASSGRLVVLIDPEVLRNCLPPEFQCNA